MANLTINLNAKLQPMHRHDLEDGLIAWMEKIELEGETTGGGSLQEKNGEIANCDIELFLEDASEENINRVINAMESMLAPKGSKIIVHPMDETKESITMSFGKHEGLGLYFNGRDLPDEVYQNNDINAVYQELSKLLDDAKLGHIASYWEGEETAFYLYGQSYEAMLECIKPVLDVHPLCEKCRTVQIA